MCQAKALIRELWPDEFATKPKLRLVGGTDVKILTPQVADKKGWNRPLPLDRLLAEKRGMTGS